MVGCELYRHARGAHFKRPISTSARAIVFFLSVLRESAEHKNRPLGCCSAAFGGFPLFERRYYLRAPYNVTLLLLPRTVTPTRDVGDDRLHWAANACNRRFFLPPGKPTICQEGCARYEHRSSLTLPAFVSIPLLLHATRR